MAVAIDISAGPKVRQRVRLDGVPFVLFTRWNTRAGLWILSIFDQAERPIILGKNMVVTFPLLRAHVFPNQPAGDFVVLDQTRGGDLGNGIDRAAFEDGRAALIYLTAAETRP